MSPDAGKHSHGCEQLSINPRVGTNLSMDRIVKGMIPWILPKNGELMITRRELRLELLICAGDSRKTIASSDNSIIIF